MKSFAVWYEPNNSNPTLDAKLDLHFNYWKLRSSVNRKKDIYYLDIGIRINEGSNVGNICLFIPHDLANNIKADVIEDLGRKMTTVEIVTAIFNENYGVTSLANQPNISVLSTSGSLLFYIHKLDINNDITLTSNYQGTIVKFAHVNYTGFDTYYRLRIKGALADDISYNYSPKNSFLENVSSNVELIDFRVNDYRNLELSLVTEMKRNKHFSIRLIHFFVMRRIEDALITSNNDTVKIRRLEKGTWNAYVDSGNINYNESIAYHLKSKAKVNNLGVIEYIADFSGLLKFSFEKYRIRVYIIWFIVIGLAFELVGNRLYDLGWYIHDKYYKNEVQNRDTNVKMNILRIDTTMLPMFRFEQQISIYPVLGSQAKTDHKDTVHP